MKAAGLKKGASAPSPSKAIAFVTPETVYEIAKVKQKDDLMWHLPLDSIARSVVGTAKSIGIGVKEDEEWIVLISAKAAAYFYDLQ